MGFPQSYLMYKRRKECTMDSTNSSRKNRNRNYNIGYVERTEEIAIVKVLMFTDLIETVDEAGNEMYQLDIVYAEIERRKDKDAWWRGCPAGYPIESDDDVVLHAESVCTMVANGEDEIMQLIVNRHNPVLFCQLFINGNESLTGWMECMLSDIRKLKQQRRYTQTV